MFGMVVVSIAFLLTRLSTCNAKEPGEPPRLEPGHGYVYTLLPFYAQTVGPWHAFYAVSPYTYFNIKPTNFYGCVVIPQLITTDTYLNDLHYIEIGPLKGRKKLNPQVGRALALRMVGIPLMYRAHRCNCRHYTDYLMYGKTFGTPYDLAYQTISDDCPLHYPLTSKTNVWDPEFKLEDRFGNKFNLAPPVAEDRNVRWRRSKSRSGSESGSTSGSESGSVLATGSDTDTD